ncbi:MAG: hypothetical protein IMF19_08070, partial [Proteobacteria bacterium]|nr:hypothetical protein [Pseudomonadota bacterium]
MSDAVGEVRVDMGKDIERYTKDDILLLLGTNLVFTIHAVNQMRLESRDI